MTRYSFFLASAVAAITLTACGSADNSTTLVKVNKGKITEAQVDEQLALLPQELIAIQGLDLRARIVDKLVEQELLLQAAKEEGVEKNPAFKKQIQDVKNSLMLSTLLQEKVDASLTDDAMRAFYEENKNALSQPQMKARHILVESEEEAAKIIAALNTASDKKAAFIEKAKSVSKGPSKDTGGDLGWFSVTDMVPAFSQAALNLQEGEISPAPVQTEFGWHVILVEGRRQSDIPAFENVEESIRQQLTQATITDYINTLKAKANIQYVEAQ